MGNPTRVANSFCPSQQHSVLRQERGLGGFNTPWQPEHEDSNFGNGELASSISSAVKSIDLSSSTGSFTPSKKLRSCWYKAHCIPPQSPGIWTPGALQEKQGTYVSRTKIRKNICLQASGWFWLSSLLYDPWSVSSPGLACREQGKRSQNQLSYCSYEH